MQQYATLPPLGVERIPAYALTLTWPYALGMDASYNDLTAAAESIDISASITTDAPDGTQFYQGYPTRSATVVLSGRVGPTGDEEHDAVWLFDPYSTTSPLFKKALAMMGLNGIQVRVSAGYANQMSDSTVPVFAGYVDTVTVDREAGQVTLTFLDYSARIRGVPAMIPQTDINLFQGNWLLSSVTLADQYYNPMTNLVVLERLLAANGIPMTPPLKTTPNPAATTGLIGWFPMVGGCYPTYLANQINGFGGTVYAQGVAGTPRTPADIVAFRNGRGDVIGAGAGFVPGKFSPQVPKTFDVCVGNFTTTTDFSGSGIYFFNSGATDKSTGPRIVVDSWVDFTKLNAAPYAGYHDASYAYIYGTAVVWQLSSSLEFGTAGVADGHFLALYPGSTAGTLEFSYVLTRGTASGSTSTSRVVTFASNIAEPSNGYHKITMSLQACSGMHTRAMLYIDGVLVTTLDLMSLVAQYSNTATLSIVRHASLQCPAENLKFGASGAALDPVGPPTTGYAGITPTDDLTWSQPSAIYIEPSLNQLNAIPQLDTTADAWSVLQALADSELGVTGYDETGTFFYWNRNHVAGGPAKVTSLVDLKSLQTEQTIQAYATAVQCNIFPLVPTVPTTVWAIDKGGYSAASPFTLPVSFSTPVLPPRVGSSVYGVIPSQGGTKPTVVGGYLRNGCSVFETSNDSSYGSTAGQDGANGWMGYSGAARPWLQPLSGLFGLLHSDVYKSGQLYQIPTNGNNVKADGTTAQAGGPAIELWSQFLTPNGLAPDDPSNSGGGATVAPVQAGTGTYPVVKLADSMFRQSAPSVTKLCQDVLAQLAYPLPHYTNVEIVADPRLQLGDAVTVEDASTTLAAMSGGVLSGVARLIGVELSIQGTSMTQTVEFRASAAPA